MKRLSLIVLLLAGCATPSPSPHGIPNLAQVSPGVFRGGQPASFESWQWLQSRGVSNVVKLNLESEGSDIPARVLHMTVTAVPIPWNEQVFGPVPGGITNAVAAIKPGTFVHCEHGQDRT